MQGDGSFDLIPFSDDKVPPSFGLNNPGVLCYLNSLLQSLVSLSSFVETVLKNPDYMKKTKTGNAMYNFISNASIGADVSNCSSLILSALMEDMKERNSTSNFGSSQESASEAFVLILDMMTPVGTKPSECPLSKLFAYRTSCKTVCKGCKNVTSSIDEGYTHNLFSNVNRALIEEDVTTQCSEISQFTCEKCGAKGPAGRCYQLSMISEVLVCTFNIYRTRNEVGKLPDSLSFRCLNGKKSIHKLASKVIHFGTVNGGHYITHCNRHDKLIMFNDSHVTEVAPLNTDTNVYMAFYQFHNLTEL